MHSELSLALSREQAALGAARLEHVDEQLQACLKGHPPSPTTSILRPELSATSQHEKSDFSYAIATKP